MRCGFVWTRGRGGEFLAWWVWKRKLLLRTCAGVCLSVVSDTHCVRLGASVSRSGDLRLLSSSLACFSLKMLVQPSHDPFRIWWL